MEQNSRIFYIAVGENDFIRDVVRKDRDALISSGIPIHYEEVKGYTHDWNFLGSLFEKGTFRVAAIEERTNIFAGLRGELRR